MSKNNNIVGESLSNNPLQPVTLGENSGKNLNTFELKKPDNIETKDENIEPKKYSLFQKFLAEFFGSVMLVYHCCGAAVFQSDKLYVAVLSNGSTKTLVCTSTKDNFNYRNEYTFSNDMLTSYEISKEYTGEEEDKTLETEFASLDASYNATYQNNVLKYTVNANLSGAEYTNGVSSYFVKSGQEAKEWKCE